MIAIHDSKELGNHVRKECKAQRLTQAQLPVTNQGLETVRHHNRDARTLALSCGKILRFEIDGIRSQYLARHAKLW